MWYRAKSNLMIKFFFPLMFNHQIRAKSIQEPKKTLPVLERRKSECTTSERRKTSNAYVFLFVFSAGNTAVQAINLLLKKGVQESNIIFLNLISVRVLFLSKLSISFAFQLWLHLNHGPKIRHYQTLLFLLFSIVLNWFFLLTLRI